MEAPGPTERWSCCPSGQRQQSLVAPKVALPSIGAHSSLIVIDDNGMTRPVSVRWGVAQGFPIQVTDDLRGNERPRRPGVAATIVGVVPRE